MKQYYKKPFQKNFNSTENLGSALEVKVEYFGNKEEDKEKALDKALVKLKKLVQKSGLLQELKEREYFKSKGRKIYEQKRQKEYKRILKSKKRKALL